MDGKHKSKLKIQSLLEDTIATFKPDIITVETFANEISNLNDAKSEEEMLLETKDKVKLIMKLLKKFKENPPKIKIVVLKPLDRNDGKTKQKKSKMVGEGEVKGARGSGIIVTFLPLQLETMNYKLREAPTEKKQLNFSFNFFICTCFAILCFLLKYFLRI